MYPAWVWFWRRVLYYILFLSAFMYPVWVCFWRRVLVTNLFCGFTCLLARGRVLYIPFLSTLFTLPESAVHRIG